MSVPAREPRRLWRLAAAVIICLLIGTTVNVLVAWGTTAAMQVRWLAFDLSPFQPAELWPFPPPQGVDHNELETWRAGIWWMDRFAAQRKVHKELVGFDEKGQRLFRDRTVITVGDTFGVPLRCLGNSNTAEGLYVPLPRNRGAVMPTYVLWPGFAANTLIYASLAYGLSWLPFMARQWRRGRRNQCPACGYSRAGLADGAKCPECGANGHALPKTA